jgi:PPM family protein phosphatase
MPKLFIDIFSNTYRGKKRDANEDTAFGFVTTPVPDAPVETLAVVGTAAGKGGAGAGDVASAAARGFIESVFMTGKATDFVFGYGLSSDDDTKLLSRVFDECNRLILHAAASAHKNGVMGATLVLGVIVYNANDDKTYLYVGNVGNCRGYIIRGEQIFHATEEDSVAWRLYKKGAITYSELLAHPLRSQITVMGIDTSISPEVHSIELRDGDIVIFCTDGVHESMNDADIYALTRRYPGAKKGCEHLLDAARSAMRGKDNAAAAMACCYTTPIQAARRASGVGRKAPRHWEFRTTAMIAIWSIVCVLAITAGAIYFHQPAAIWNVKGFFGRPLHTGPEPSVPRSATDSARAPAAEKQPLEAADSSISADDNPTFANADRGSVVEKKTDARRRSSAPAQRPSAARPAAADPRLRVEWNAETERFRITTIGSSAVPTRLRYGSIVFDVVPVKSMPNLYRTTMPLSRPMISGSKVVHVTVANSKNPIAVVFTQIQ